MAAEMYSEEWIKQQFEKLAPQIDELVSKSFQGRGAQFGAQGAIASAKKAKLLQEIIADAANKKAAQAEQIRRENVMVQENRRREEAARADDAVRYNRAQADYNTRRMQAQSDREFERKKQYEQADNQRRRDALDYFTSRFGGEEGAQRYKDWERIAYPSEQTDRGFFKKKKKDEEVTSKPYSQDSTFAGESTGAGTRVSKNWYMPRSLSGSSGSSGSGSGSVGGGGSNYPPSGQGQTDVYNRDLWSGDVSKSGFEKTWDDTKKWFSDLGSAISDWFAPAYNPQQETAGVGDVISKTGMTDENVNEDSGIPNNEEPVSGVRAARGFRRYSPMGVR